MLSSDESSTESGHQLTLAKRTAYLLSAIREQCAIAEEYSEITQLADGLASKLVSKATHTSSDGNSKLTCFD